MSYGKFVNSIRNGLGILRRKEVKTPLIYSVVGVENGSLHPDCYRTSEDDFVEYTERELSVIMEGV